MLGIVAGIVSGMLGLGSGSVVVPALVHILSFPQKSAQGTALTLMVPVALLGAFRYWKNPEIEVSLAIVALLVVGAMPGVLVGTELSGRLPSHILRKFFAVFLAIIAVKMFTFSPKKATKAPGEGSANQANANLVESRGQKSEPAEQ